MKHEELEKSLKKKIFLRRSVEAAALFIFSVVAIVFTSLREASKEITVIGTGFLSYESVSYSEDYSVGIIVGALVASVAFSLLISDLIFLRCVSHDTGLYHITLYRGFIHNTVYVDGIEKGEHGFFGYSPVAETRLDNGTKITVSFLRGVFFVAHISFSDNTPSVEI